MIGGGEIYKQFLDKDLIDRVMITWVDAKLEADVFFPKLNSNWELCKQSQYNLMKKINMNSHLVNIKKDRQL